MRPAHLTILLALLVFSLPAASQRRAASDVEVKTVRDGKVTTVTKSVYVSINGRSVTVFHYPTTYYAVTNSKGELQLYYPSTREVVVKTDQTLSSAEELLMLYLQGKVNDLGLSAYGYKGSSAVLEDGLLKRSFISSDPSRPTVEIVYQDYLPIYCCYTSASGELMSKRYFSHYRRESRFVFPERVTEIIYHKKDSVVVRSLYSNLRIDSDDSEFGFEIPSDAKPAVVKSKD